MPERQVSQASLPKHLILFPPGNRERGCVRAAERADNENMSKAGNGDSFNVDACARLGRCTNRSRPNASSSARLRNPNAPGRRSFSFTSDFWCHWSSNLESPEARIRRIPERTIYRADFFAHRLRRRDRRQSANVPANSGRLVDLRGLCPRPVEATRCLRLERILCRFSKTWIAWRSTRRSASLHGRAGKGRIRKLPEAFRGRHAEPGDGVIP
jgi:hypothetical protein